MNDFAGMEELLSDFLLEAGEMLSDVDSKLMELEKRPNDSNLLNEVFRGFHTIKGGAGFLGMNAVKTLAHAAEDLLNKIRNKDLVPTAPVICPTTTLGRICSRRSMCRPISLAQMAKRRP